MSSNPPASPLKHLWNTAQVAAVIVTLIGFTPDNWVARLLRAANLENLSASLPDADYRLLLVGLGVSIFAGDVVIRNRRTRKQIPSNAATVARTADSDDIARKPSIAVLPFVNMSDDKSQEYFADGMTEDIITGLSCDSRLNVTARNSTFAYKGQSPDIRAVGKELGVRYVLEGSIRPVNERLRITVQLIETASGNHVWADKIDRPTAELFDIMDDVVDGLVTALSSNLGVAEGKRAARARPEDLQAWALCVQAEVLFFSQVDTKTLLQAEKLARQATEIEPGYAVGWAMLASLSSLRMPHGMSADLAGDSEQVMSLAGKALRLAANDPVVLAHCGYAAAWAGRAGPAVDYLERSLAINPNSSFTRFAYGAALFCDGRIEEGATQFQLFIRRSPKDPYVVMAYFYLTYAYLFSDDFQRAEQSARNCAKHAPAFEWGYVALATALAAQGRDEEAQAHMQQVHKLAPGWTLQQVEDWWNHLLRKPGMAERAVALTRLAWKD